MKKMIIVIVVKLLLSTNTFATELSSTNRFEESQLALFLLSKTLTITPTSTYKPIIIYINQEGNLRAEFHQDQGEILIQITDNTNTPVYESIVNTSFEREAYIPASTLPTGTYTIYFIIDDDNYWYAEFQL